MASNPVPQQPSVHSAVHKNQGEMFPETQHGEFRRLPQWEDLHPDDRKEFEAHMKSAHGLSMSQATRNYGRRIDAGFQRAEHQKAFREGITGEHSDEPVRAEGQSYYAGGATGDPSSAVGAPHLRRISQETGRPYQDVAHARAAVSPNESAEREVHVTRNVVKHVQGGGTAEDIGPGHGMGGMHVTSRNAARILEHPETHPFDVQGEKLGHPGMMGAPALPGPKPPSYAQSYTHPGREDVRPAIDRWGIRAAFTRPLEDKEEAKIQEGGTKAYRAKRGDLAGEHMGNLFLAHALSTASRQRGLAPAEGQTTMWHDVRGEADRNKAAAIQSSQFKQLKMR